MSDTARVLREQFGYAEGASANDRFRFQTGQSPIAGVIDLLCQPDRRRGAMGTGTIHHIAFRAADDGEHLALRGALVQSGLNVTPVLDRTYFKSIYFREPGGVIFEVATDGPGMLIDESRETLGESLRLPSWLEGNRQQIESILPTIHLPGKKLQ